MGFTRAYNSIKIWRNLTISYPKPDLYNINAHTQLYENPLMFTVVIIQKPNTDGRNYEWRTDRRRAYECQTWNRNTPIVWRGM